MYSSLATSVPLLFRLCTTVQRKSRIFKSVVVLISASTSVRCEAQRTTRLITPADQFVQLHITMAQYRWLLRQGAGSPKGVPDGPGEQYPPDRTAYVALVLLLVQVLLGAVTVKLSLPPWTVILHLGTAMLLLATLMVAARGRPSAPASWAGLWALGLGFATVLFGALTANLGAASACLGFPLCNGQLAPDGNSLQYVHWTHRLLAYTLFAYTLWWAARTRARWAWGVVALVILQIAVGAVMVLLALPPPLQAAHVAVGAAVWAALVLAVA